MSSKSASSDLTPAAARTSPRCGEGLAPGGSPVSIHGRRSGSAGFILRCPL